MGCRNKNRFCAENWQIGLAEIARIRCQRSYWVCKRQASAVASSQRSAPLDRYVWACFRSVLSVRLDVRRMRPPDQGSLSAQHITKWLYASQFAVWTTSPLAPQQKRRARHNSHISCTTCNRRHLASLERGQQSRLNVRGRRLLAVPAAPTPVSNRPRISLPGRTATFGVLRAAIWT